MEPFFVVNSLLLKVNNLLHWLQARIARKNTANLTPARYTSATPLAALDTNHHIARVPGVLQQHTSFLPHSPITADSAETNTPSPEAPTDPPEDAAVPPPS